MRSVKKLRDTFGSLQNLWNHSQIHLVHDGFPWVLREITESIADALNEHGYARASASPFYHFLKSPLIHFNGVTPTQAFKQKKVIMTWYHVLEEDKRLLNLQTLAKQVNLIHTPAKTTMETLVAAGFPAERIVVLPAGIQTTDFSRVDADKRRAIRLELQISDTAFVIGSFQKDGCGWGEGMEPKWIKGPDVFCETISRVKQSHPVHILLTGPSRGYVQHRLEQLRVPYTHRYPASYHDINRFYHACDAYLISSRLEGIPMALLESWATGIPLVSTQVGMVKDVAIHGQTALLAEVGDCDKLAQHLVELIEHPERRERLMETAFREVKKYDWKHLIHRYWKHLYSPL